jgi:hypothetical protein
MKIDPSNIKWTKVAEANSVEELAADPKKYGLPTPAEFRKNIDQWRNIMAGRTSSEHLFESVDRGSLILGRQITKYRFFVEGYEVKSNERAQALVNQMGIKDLEIYPETVSIGGGLGEMHVHFCSKSKRARRMLNAAINAAH